MQGQAFSEVFYEIGANPLFQFDSILGRNSLVVPARDVFHVKLATPQHPLIGVTWLAALAIGAAARPPPSRPSLTHVRRQHVAAVRRHPDRHDADQGADRGTARHVGRAGRQASMPAACRS